ncbi:hypothetical protein Micbo1qcDRAFT_206336 [Microdochium bolleyi]|uniref:Uncharacterized protein n=1 Tax=Microdochium bolleyi TaxID=196109 RepID=A0A136IWJ9_9PEZI|nr:hypothetical protein Micbo1qcDRAFT_206336 [Microdochium bolleyi]
MKSAIIALLATVAMAAPSANIEARQGKNVQACACINAAGQSTVGACLNGNGGTVNLDGQSYCYPYRANLEARVVEIFSPSACANGYPLFPQSSCKTIRVCPTFFDQQGPC